MNNTHSTNRGQEIEHLSLKGDLVSLFYKDNGELKSIFLTQAQVINALECYLLQARNPLESQLDLGISHKTLL